MNSLPAGLRVRSTITACMFVVLMPGMCISAPAANSAPAADASRTDSADSPQTEKLATVIITAQKRKESLQVVPVSVQVVTSRVLREQNYNNLSDLTQVTPDVSVSHGLFFNSIYIRGVGATASVQQEQAVPIFVDGIYYGRSRMTDASFLDIDRIEVLKGPQSTFFGENAIAGAISIITQNPSLTQWDGWARALYGSYNQFAAEGAVGGPITHDLGVRVAVTGNGEGGWIRNIVNGQDLGVQRDEAARITFLYKPSAAFDATLKYQYSHHRENGYDGSVNQMINCPPPAPLVPSFSDSGVCAYALTAKLPMGLDNNSAITLPGQFTQLTAKAYLLTANYRVAGDTLTSLPGYNSYDYNAVDSSSGWPTNVLVSDLPEHYHQFSQELRLTSPADQPLEYMVGAYFERNHIDFVHVGGGTVLNVLAPLIPPLAPYLPFGTEAGFTQNQRTFSGFASITWNITPQWKLSAGLRGSRVWTQATGFQFFGSSSEASGGPVVFIPVAPAGQALYDIILNQISGVQPRQQRTDRAWMPSASVRYQVKPNAMVYLSYSRGFLAGGFDSSSLSKNYVTVYRPEFVNAYELGLKSKWLDDRLLANVALFLSNYRDLQVQSSVYLPPPLNGYIPTITNAAASRSQGVELGTQWLAGDGFRLGADITYLKSYYVSFPDAPLTTLETFTNPGLPFHSETGQPTPHAPKFSGSVSADYTISLSDNYEMTAELRPYFTSQYSTEEYDDIFSRVPGYVRLDGRLSINTVDGRWGLDLIGKNLTNRIIVDNPSLYFASKEEPVNVAIQLRYNW